MSTEQTWTQETQTAAKRRVLNRLGLSLKEQEDALAEIERARGEIERLTQQVEILATRSAAAEARLLTVRATPAPLTEAEARAWGDAVSVTMLYDDRPGNGARIAAAILAASRGDFPAEVRPRPPKREPMSGDFDFASCQHPEHARNEADDGTTWCILCGDVLSAGRCGKIAPDGYPGAGNPCTLPAGHGSGHEARSADGRLLAVSLPPAPGDIPASIRPEADPAVQAAIRGLERVAPVGPCDVCEDPITGTRCALHDGGMLDVAPAEMAVTTGERHRIGAWRYEPKTGLYTRHDERGLSMCEVYRSAHEERGTGWHRRPFLPPIGVDEEGVVAAMAVCDRALATWADLDTSNDEPSEVKP